MGPLTHSSHKVSKSFKKIRSRLATRFEKEPERPRITNSREHSLVQLPVRVDETCTKTPKCALNGESFVLRIEPGCEVQLLERCQLRSMRCCSVFHTHLRDGHVGYTATYASHDCCYRVLCCCACRYLLVWCSETNDQRDFVQQSASEDLRSTHTVVRCHSLDHHCTCVSTRTPAFRKATHCKHADCYYRPRTRRRSAEVSAGSARVGLAG